MPEDMHRKLVDGMLDHPAFEEAWKVAGDWDPGSVAAVEKLLERLRASDAHMARLCDLTNQLVGAAGEWASSVDWATIDAASDFDPVDHRVFSDEDFKVFQCKVGNELGTIAAAYFVMGAFVGFLATSIKDKKKPH